MSQYKGTGEPLIPVETAAPLWITDSRHWGIATGAPNIESSDPYSNIMPLIHRQISQDILVPNIHIFQ